MHSHNNHRSNHGRHSNHQLGFDLNEFLGNLPSALNSIGGKFREFTEPAARFGQEFFNAAGFGGRPQNQTTTGARPQQSSAGFGSRPSNPTNTGQRPQQNTGGFGGYSQTQPNLRAQPNSRPQGSPSHPEPTQWSDPRGGWGTELDGRMGERIKANHAKEPVRNNFFGSKPQEPQQAEGLLEGRLGERLKPNGKPIYSSTDRTFV